MGIFEISHDVISSQRGASIPWKTVAIERINTFLYLLIIRSHQTGCEAAKRKRRVFRETIICRFFSRFKTSAVLMGLSSIRNQLR